jgi:glycerophosphoryl diester phosphodiesterase
MKQLLKKFALSASVMACCVNMSAVEIIAHRGASYDAPENTVVAYKIGFQQGAEAGETDLHLTKDGKVIVSHDGDTARTTGVKGKIVEQNFAELRKLEAGKWGKFKDQTFAEKMPTMEEVLATVPDGKRMYLEIKIGSEILPEFEKVLKQVGKKADQTPIIGFGYETMRDAKARMPHLKVYWLVSADKNTKKFPPVEELIAKAKEAKLDGLDLNYGFPIDKEFVKKVHAAGLKLITWTVDDAEVAKRHVEAGVDGITTNRPGWLREQLGLKK